MDSANSSFDWAEDLLPVLRTEGIRHVTTVPDGGLASLLKKCEEASDINVTTLTSEEEGVAFACGAWLGGEKAVLFMQSSGVGNCINMLALPSVCRMPCLMLVAMRGEEGEFNPWQVPMARGVPDVFAAMGVTTYRPATAMEIGQKFASAAGLVYETGTTAAVLVSQHIVGVKVFDEEKMR